MATWPVSAPRTRYAGLSSPERNTPQKSTRQAMASRREGNMKQSPFSLLETEQLPQGIEQRVPAAGRRLVFRQCANRAMQELILQEAERLLDVDLVVRG